MRKVDEISMGMGQNSVSPIDELTLAAISIAGGPTPPPPGKLAFPWWLVGLGAVAAVIIRARNIMKKKA